MKSLNGKDLARLLERHGWRLMRVNGSHHIREAGQCRPSFVPIHGNQALKAGLLNHLLKLAEIAED
jgi:predicted RNA binding protein YcfA (HicA-like mRNA interferase family)